MSTVARNFHDIQIPEPMKTGIILRREDGVVMTNVPHVVVWHSPDGYEWGYAGSGPADLALNIVENALRLLGFSGPREKCFEGTAFLAACKLHQDFKAEFIIDTGEAGKVIAWADVAEWIRANVEAMRASFEPAGSGLPEFDDVDVAVGRFN